MKFIAILLLLFAFTASSCSISFEKRRYRPGYYVDMVKPVSHKRKVENQFFTVSSNEMRPVLVSTTDSQNIKIPQPSNVLVITKPISRAFSNNRNAKLPGVLAHSKIYDDGCDVIYFKNGTTRQVTSIRVVERKLYYTNCGDNTAKVVPINIRTIKSIRLANGDVMDPNSDYMNLVKSNEKEQEKKDRGSGKLVGTILMAVFGAVGIGLAVLFFLLAASMTGWGGIIPAILLYFLGGLFAIGALVLIVMSIVTGVRKQ